jgi:hypothetical protein
MESMRTMQLLTLVIMLRWLALSRSFLLLPQPLKRNR